jgi:hypothetical protein
MFTLAFLIGTYSYSIFTLGILNLLTTTNILFISAIFILISLYILWPHLNFSFPKLSIHSKLLLTLIIALCLVNFIGVLGPEIGFDALWYHLSLPKLWLQFHSLIFIPGSQFKYSVMPSLTEMFYFFPQVSKVTHYIFGLLALFVTYKLSRKFLSQEYSLLATLIMASNQVFAWESTTAYIDLARTFFEVLALYLFVSKKYYQSALILGLAICTKLVAFISLPIFIVLLLINKVKIRTIFIYSILTISVVAPWLIHSYIATGNPLYPMFSSAYPVSDFSFNLKDIWILFTQNSDPINPIYIISAPLIMFMLSKLRSRPACRQVGDLANILVYCSSALALWFITPRTGGGRFILPYLPAFSLISAFIISDTSNHIFKKIIVITSIFIAFSTLIYRTAANWKYLPTILGYQTKQSFLATHLNYSFGDFSDIDGSLEKFVKPNQNILVIGINNIFYIPAHVFTLDTLKPTDKFTFILWRYTDAPFPNKYSSWFEIYHNPVTKIKLFAPQPTTTASQIFYPAVFRTLSYK